MNIHKGPLAIAIIPRTPTRFVAFVQILLVKMKGNPQLPNPDPSVAEYEAAVTLLVDAETKDKTPASVADRDAKALKVFQLIGRFVNYVQGVANSQVSAADAIAIILGAGLQVKKTSTRKKPELAVKYTGFSGQVLLVALAIARAGAYYWEYSLDQKAWTTVPETTGLRTTIAGLTPGQMYYFRFRALTNKGKTDYSQVVSLIMH